MKLHGFPITTLLAAALLCLLHTGCASDPKKLADLKTRAGIPLNRFVPPALLKGDNVVNILTAHYRSDRFTSGTEAPEQDKCIALCPSGWWTTKLKCKSLSPAPGMIASGRHDPSFEPSCRVIGPGADLERALANVDKFEGAFLSLYSRARYHMQEGGVQLGPSNVVPLQQGPCSVCTSYCTRNNQPWALTRP